MLLSDDVCLSICLSVAYIGPKSRTERPRKTKIGTEIVHVTRDTDTTFKVKRSKVKGHQAALSPFHTGPAYSCVVPRTLYAEIIRVLRRTPAAFS